VTGVDRRTRAAGRAGDENSPPAFRSRQWRGATVPGWEASVVGTGPAVCNGFSDFSGERVKSNPRSSDGDAET